MKTIGCVQHDCPECKEREARAVEPGAYDHCDYDYNKTMRAIEIATHIQGPNTLAISPRLFWETYGMPTTHKPSLSVEREEMIARLRLMSEDTIGPAAADMLAADAQAMLSNGERAQFLADTLRELDDVKAQQVAVPQEVVTLGGGYPGDHNGTHRAELKALSLLLRKTDGPVTLLKKKVAIADAVDVMLSTPQPPQAERVPTNLETQNDQ